MTKNLEDFNEDLGARESGGNYKSKNKYGYLGKYQMGEAALIDAGYYTKKSGNYNNDWSGQFTGKDGVYSADDFLNNPSAQENAQNAYKQRQWQYLKAAGADKYVGSTINGIEITPSGLLAGAHLKGVGGVMSYLKSNGQNIGTDAFGTSVESYIKKFSGYDVSGIIGNKIPTVTNPINKQNNNEIENTNNAESPFTLYGHVEENVNYKDIDNNKVYTFEEIKKMKPKEFLKNQKRILEEFTSGRMMHESEAKEKVKSGELIYVESYTRQDGTKVSGYYRRR